MTLRPSTRLGSASVALTLTLALASTSLAQADTPSPTPASPTAVPSTPAAAPPTPAEPTASVAAPSSSAPSSPAPSAPTTDSPSNNSPSVKTQADSAAITLAVGSTGGPVAGAFYQDLGAYAISGQVSGVADGTPVVIARRTASTDLAKFATATVKGGRYSVRIPVTSAGGTFTFRASTAAGGDGETPVTSNLVEVTVRDATLALDKPVTKIDSLVNPTLAGAVVPARAGVKVNIDVLKSGRYRTVASTVTDAAGRYRTTFAYGKGKLATYSIRTAYLAANSDRWEKSGSHSLARIAVVNAKITDTTAAEVAKTYHKGCPVGRSKLKTVTMNFYGRDKVMHRGVIIIRSDLTTELVRGFKSALDHRYPVAKMNNPNVYGGNDPKQMTANNTSGFNCRKVVGNPYRQSPHSYGIALDVNTVQNPYRDAKGKWWPTNGKSYINRKNKRAGMLYSDSYLTASLRKDKFFWGGYWNPGRDYQHFQYTK